MSTDLAKPMDPLKAFQEKVADKLKKDIGELLPPEVLDGMVAKAIKETFFAPTKTKQLSYPYHEVEGPSWFVKAVSEQAKPLLEAEVKKFVKSKSALLEEALTKFLTDNQLLLMVMDHLRQDTASQIHQLNQELTDLRENVAKAGKQGS